MCVCYLLCPQVQALVVEFAHEVSAENISIDLQ